RQVLHRRPRGRVRGRLAVRRSEAALRGVHRERPGDAAVRGVDRAGGAGLVDAGPTLEQIRAARERLGDRVIETPVRVWDEPSFAATRVFLKEELFQRTGSFKPRGALSVMLSLAPAALERGVTAVSAGNHAMAVAYAARSLGSS